MTKKTIFLFIIFFALCYPMVGASAYELLFKNGLYISTSESSGIITSSYDYYAGKCYFADSLVYFENLTMGFETWDIMGLNCSPQNSILNLKKVTSSMIKYSVYAPQGASISQIYVGSKGRPAQIYNAYKQEYDETTELLTLYVSHTLSKNRNIEIIWSNIQMEPETEIDELIRNTDFLQAIKLIWTNKLGTVVFPAIIFLVLGVVMYMRYQSFIPPVFFGILIFVLIMPSIPASLIGFMLLLMVMGVAIIFYWLFVRERK